MSGSADVVVVGGGIAGSSFATVLARDGYQVVVLERQTAYRDKVRGEVLACWGVADLLQLDLEKPLLDAGGHYATRAVLYDEMIDPDARRGGRCAAGPDTAGVPGHAGCRAPGGLRGADPGRRGGWGHCGPRRRRR